MMTRSRSSSSRNDPSVSFVKIRRDSFRIAFTNIERSVKSSEGATINWRWWAYRWPGLLLLSSCRSISPALNATSALVLVVFELLLFCSARQNRRMDPFASVFRFGYTNNDNTALAWVSIGTSECGSLLAAVVDPWFVGDIFPRSSSSVPERVLLSLSMFAILRVLPPMDLRSDAFLFATNLTSTFTPMISSGSIISRTTLSSAVSSSTLRSCRSSSKRKTHLLSVVCSDDRNIPW
mmetsp:Transcript_8071/g.17389  ORF Transcript_8071/g.17389 Transcript_8071/m.17389 type:complete len:236 (-) Transcript_8071:175-882(-)